MKKVGLGVAGLVALLVVVLGVGYAWASSTAASVLAQRFEAHTIDFPVPFPLTDTELAALRAERTPEPEPPPVEAATQETSDATEPSEEVAAPLVDVLADVDLDALALERAVERGRHLVNARYACIECHGDDFGGGLMVDDPMVGSLHGPNLTGGEGSRVADWSVADWDRAVRHGVFPDGAPSFMPAEDYQRMSDRELSDIIAYVRSFPAVSRVVEPPRLGPLGTFLLATGQLPLSVMLIEDHQSAHATAPPEAAPTVEFGRHLAGVCTGCHRADFRGGPIAAGPPDWLPGANLTPHAEGLEGWTFEDFRTVMREFRRPDGTELRPPMTLMQRYIANMTDVELEALWAYLQTLEPQPTGT